MSGNGSDRRTICTGGLVCSLIGQHSPLSLLDREIAVFDDLSNPHLSNSLTMGILISSRPASYGLYLSFAFCAGDVWTDSSNTHTDPLAFWRDHSHGRSLCVNGMVELNAPSFSLNPPQVCVFGKRRARVSLAKDFAPTPTHCNLATTGR